MKSYLFYDIETTGLNKCFDQVIQFAAIKTDLELNVIDEYEFKVKLNPDVIPNPCALLTHEIAIKEMMSGMSEFEAISRIHKLMNEPETISLGYNTLGFDDEFLRFSFYKNLLPPYTHQYANQCSRMDIYPITVMFFLFKPEAVNWPHDVGQYSLKLADLNDQNRWLEGKAHDAMVDVKVTVELARHLMSNQSQWNYTKLFFSKLTDKERLANLTPSLVDGYKQGLMIHGKFGYNKFYQMPVLLLGQHRRYSNQYWFLRLDQNLQTKSRDDIDNLLKEGFIYHKKIAENTFVLPFNQRFLKYLTPERLKIVEENNQWLATDDQFLDEIREFYLNYTYPETPKTDIDAALYLNSFWNDQDLYDCKRFHQASMDKKSAVIEQIRNKNIVKLATRLLGRLDPNKLSKKQRSIFNHYMETVFADDSPIDFRGNRRYNKSLALIDIDKLKNENLPDKKRQLIDELEDYILITLEDARFEFSKKTKKF